MQNFSDKPQDIFINEIMRNGHCSNASPLNLLQNVNYLGYNPMGTYYSIFIKFQPLFVQNHRKTKTNITVQKL